MPPLELKPRKLQIQKADPDLSVHVLTIGFVGLLGLAIGRYSHLQ